MQGPNTLQPIFFQSPQKITYLDHKKFDEILYSDDLSGITLRNPKILKTKASNGLYSGCTIVAILLVNDCEKLLTIVNIIERIFPNKIRKQQRLLLSWDDHWNSPLAFLKDHRCRNSLCLLSPLKEKLEFIGKEADLQTCEKSNFTSAFYEIFKFITEPPLTLNEQYLEQNRARILGFKSPNFYYRITIGVVAKPGDTILHIAARLIHYGLAKENFFKFIVHWAKSSSDLETKKWMLEKNYLNETFQDISKSSLLSLGPKEFVLFIKPMLESRNIRDFLKYSNLFNWRSRENWYTEENTLIAKGDSFLMVMVKLGWGSLLKETLEEMENSHLPIEIHILLNAKNSFGATLRDYLPEFLWHITLKEIQEAIDVRLHNTQFFNTSFRSAFPAFNPSRITLGHVQTQYRNEPQATNSHPQNIPHQRIREKRKRPEPSQTSEPWYLALPGKRFQALPIIPQPENNPQTVSEAPHFSRNIFTTNYPLPLPQIILDTPRQDVSRETTSATQNTTENSQIETEIEGIVQENSAENIDAEILNINSQIFKVKNQIALLRSEMPTRPKNSLGLFEKGSFKTFLVKLKKHIKKFITPLTQYTYLSYQLEALKQKKMGINETFLGIDKNKVLSQVKDSIINIFSEEYQKNKNINVHRNTDLGPRKGYVHRIDLNKKIDKWFNQTCEQLNLNGENFLPNSNYERGVIWKKEREYRDEVVRKSKDLGTGRIAYGNRTIIHKPTFYPKTDKGTYDPQRLQQILEGLPHREGPFAKAHFDFESPRDQAYWLKARMSQFESEVKRLTPKEIEKLQTLLKEKKDKISEWKLDILNKQHTQSVKNLKSMQKLPPHEKLNLKTYFERCAIEPTEEWTHQFLDRFFHPPKPVKPKHPKYSATSKNPPSQDT